MKKETEVKRRYEAQILSKMLVNGCAVGFRETAGAVTDKVCVVVYVIQKAKVVSAEDMVPRSLGDIVTDVQENPPLGALAAYTLSTGTPAPQTYYCNRYECMEYQKKQLLDKNLTSTLDILMSVDVPREAVIRSAKKTRLWPILKMQLSDYQRYGEPIRGPGQSAGFLGMRAERLPYPDAALFMRKLRRDAQRKHRKTALISSDRLASNVEYTSKVVNPSLGMEVTMQGAVSGIVKGKIVGVDASVFVDYAPWMFGVAMGEPVFSPAPAQGGQFPVDIVALTDVGVTPRFSPDAPDCPYRKLFKNVRHYRRAYFVEQLVTNIPAKPGDSGAPLSDKKGNMVGVLFAGTKRFSYFHPYNLLRKRFDIQLLATRSFSGKH
jgi:hypothetical protein